MAKIILNHCYGGYSWSNRAILDYLDMSGKRYELVRGYNEESVPISREEFVSTLKLDAHAIVGDDTFYCRELNREDPIAIKILEEKGSEYCSGRYAKLVIREYDENLWIPYIDEYDGFEGLKLVARLSEKKIRACKSVDEIVALLDKLGLFTEKED